MHCSLGVFLKKCPAAKTLENSNGFDVCTDKTNTKIALLAPCADVKTRPRANQFFKLDGLVEMVTRRISEDFNAFLDNSSRYQNTQFQKLICPENRPHAIAFLLFLPLKNNNLVAR